MRLSVSLTEVKGRNSRWPGQQLGILDEALAQIMIRVEVVPGERGERRRRVQSPADQVPQDAHELVVAQVSPVFYFEHDRLGEDVRPRSVPALFGHP